MDEEGQEEVKDNGQENDEKIGEAVDEEREGGGGERRKREGDEGTGHE